MLTLIIVFTFCESKDMTIFGNYKLLSLTCHKYYDTWCTLTCMAVNFVTLLLQLHALYHNHDKCQKVSVSASDVHGVKENTRAK